MENYNILKISGNDFEQSANTYKLNARDKVLIATSKSNLYNQG
jgi:hypothetical protein